MVQRSPDMGRTSTTESQQERDSPSLARLVPTHSDRCGHGSLWDVVTMKYLNICESRNKVQWCCDLIDEQATI